MSRTREDTSSSTERLLSRLRFADPADNTTTPTEETQQLAPSAVSERTLAGRKVTFIDDYNTASTPSPAMPTWQRKLITTSDLDGNLPVNREALTRSAPETTSPIHRRSTTELKTGTLVTDTRSFHKTSLYQVLINNKHETVYFKENTPNSPMSEIEATAVGYFRLLAPEHFPPARAYVDTQGRYVGVSSIAAPDFVPLKKAPLTAADLENKKMVTDLAVILTTSYIFEEDDLHSENLSKNGVRIDGDMLLWPILCKFKPSGYGTNWLFRTPDKSTFNVTANDIRNFPDIQDAHPFFWPTRAIPATYKTALDIVKALGVSLSKDYQESERDLFKSLKTNKWFIYTKYKTLLKYVLTDAKMYRKIANLHMRDTLTFENKNLIDIFVKHEEARILEFRHVLTRMQEFKDFISSEDGQLALNEIIAEFDVENKKVTNKLKELGESREHDNAGDNVTPPSREEKIYADLIINTEEIKLRYSEICQETLEDKLASSRLWTKI